MTVEHYEPEVVQVSDYYAFGLEMPGRTYRNPFFSGTNEYRYGFNAKELDKSGEFGSLTHYDYGFRIYNPSIGKFLSVDPLTKSYPMLTPYQFASNTPIQAIDLDGLEAKIVVHEIGSNSTMSYTVDLNDPKINRNNILYADKEKYGTRGDLTVIKKVGSEDIIEIFEISTLDWVKNKWDQLTDDTYTGSTQGSGINLTSRNGGGPMESRVIPLDGAKSTEISDLITYANFTKFMKLPTSSISELLKNPEEIADLTDLTLDINEEVNSLIENSNQTKVTPNYLDEVPEKESLGKDTFNLPNGKKVERTKEKQGSQEIITKKPINSTKNEKN